MTEQEALRDLVSSEGWRYLETFAATELSIRGERIFNAANSTDPVELGWLMKAHQQMVTVVRLFLSWPQRRADELDRREGRSSKPVTTDTRGGA